MFNVIFSLFASLLVLQLVYPFITVLLAQLFGKEQIAGSISPNLPPIDYACVITAYRQAAIAKPLVESLLHQTHQDFIIYLVADDCPELDFGISDPRFVLLRPEPSLHLKAKSIQFAMDHFQRMHPYVVVFDADNLAHPRFLEEITRYVRAGFVCIQGQRTAKNLNTIYAALDSMGEYYKNYIEREVPSLLGGSAVISGSGMATETNIYKSYLDSPEIEQGKQQWKKMLQEDKILQNYLLRRGNRIVYARNAIVYDEKVETGQAVETQRSRWLFSYFQNVPNALDILQKGVRSLDFNQIYFSLVTLALPMFIQVGLAIAFASIALFFNLLWTLGLCAALAFFAMGILWSLKLGAAPPPVWQALWQAPRFILRQFVALFKMRDPNKYFKHTEHRNVISVDEVLGQHEEMEAKSKP